MYQVSVLADATMQVQVLLVAQSRVHACDSAAIVREREVCAHAISICSSVCAEACRWAAQTPLQLSQCALPQP